jgi:hypothetical protein
MRVHSVPPATIAITTGSRFQPESHAAGRGAGPQ